MRILAGGSSGYGRQMTMGLSSTAIFGDFDCYFFGDFSDKTSNIIWRYATPCQPVIDCKMNDVEWLFYVKIRFRSALLDSERFTLKNNCVKSNKHSIEGVMENAGLENDRPTKINGVENARLENDGLKNRAGKCRTGIWRTGEQGWKMQDWKMTD